jgi:hypothetical protein
MNRIGSDSYPVLPKLVHPDCWLSERLSFHNIANRGALLCARSGEKTALAQSSPLYRSQGHVSRRGAQARIAWLNAPRDAVDVTWKRNGGEYAWSFVRISRVFGISSTKGRSPGCIGCEQTAAKRDEPKNASTGTWLSDVDIFLRSILALAEIRDGTRGNFEREAHGKTHSLRLVRLRSTLA